MRFVDAHCHIDQYPDPKAVAAAAEASQTYTIAVSNLPSALAIVERIAAGRKFVRAAAGLHPELVAQHPRAVDDLLVLLERTKYVGEIGLDYTRASTADRLLQRDVLARVIERCESLGGRILTLHSRRAADDVIDAVRGVTRSTVILHWFSGSLKCLNRAIAQRCFFSVNPGMARSISGRAVIAAIPDDLLLTETDGPFVQYEGRAVYPADVASFISALAKLRDCTPQELRALVMQNFRRAVMIG